MQPRDKPAVLEEQRGTSKSLGSIASRNLARDSSAPARPAIDNRPGGAASADNYHNINLRQLAAKIHAFPQVARVHMKLETPAEARIWWREALSTWRGFALVLALVIAFKCLQPIMEVIYPSEFEKSYWLVN